MTRCRLSAAWAHVEGTGTRDTILLGDCAIRCLAIGDENNEHVQAYGDNLVVTGNTLILDSAGSAMSFAQTPTPFASTPSGHLIVSNTSNREMIAFVVQYTTKEESAPKQRNFFSDPCV